MLIENVFCFTLVLFMTDGAGADPKGLAPISTPVKKLISWVAPAPQHNFSKVVFIYFYKNNMRLTFPHGFASRS